MYKKNINIVKFEYSIIKSLLHVFKPVQPALIQTIIQILVLIHLHILVLIYVQLFLHEHILVNVQ